MRYAALYAAAELAAAALLVWTLGLGWALVVLAATSLAGLLLAASQVKGTVSGIRRRNTPAALTDGMLVGIGSFLVFLPGLLTTVAGALMLAPPTRGAMRPMAQSMVTRGLVRRVNLGEFAPRRDYIDGEVIDGDILPPNLPAVR